MKPTPQKAVAIIGGGWAGLAAAITLCSQGFKVSVFESSPQLGGRARGIDWKGMTLDNGQHLMIGAYQEMLGLLKQIGAAESDLFKRLPHRMLMLDAQAKTAKPIFDLSLPTFPAPFHLLLGIFYNKQLSLREKTTLLIRFNRLLNTPIHTDISVTDWLNSARLPALYVEALLKPVCLAALTTHPQDASARCFQTVLQQTFNGPAEYTDLLIPTTDLGHVLPSLAATYIQQQGGTVHTRHKLQSLHIKNGQLKSLLIGDADGNSQPHSFDHVILATPAKVTAGLLEPYQDTHAISRQLEGLEYESVTTLYLEFAAPVTLTYPMIGILNGATEWLFERTACGQPNLLAAVISAAQNLDRATLAEQVISELKALLPWLPDCIDHKLITEKRAAFHCQPGVDQYRPGLTTSLPQLSLCGDYIYIEENNQPGLPSTLEGALRSGVKCAQRLIQSAAKPESAA